MSRRLCSFANRRIPSLKAAVVFASLVAAIVSPAGADDGADAIINKGIKAMGGEARLAKARARTSKIKGTDDAGEFKIEQTTDGLDRMRSRFERFGGNKFTLITVIDGDKGWRKVVGEMDVIELEGEELADAKWTHFSGLVALTLVPLKGRNSEFKMEVVEDEQVGDGPAAGVKVTGPDDQDFIIYFDKNTGLPVKDVKHVPDPESPDQEFTQETYFSDYEDFGGIKQATKFEIKRDGRTLSKFQVVEVKILDKVDDKAFEKPE